MNVKLFVLFLISFLPLHAININLSVASVDNVAILHVKDSHLISCESKNEAYNKKIYLCVFEGSTKNTYLPQKTPYVELNFISKDDRFYLFIKPLVYSKLINSDTNLYENKEVVANNQKQAKHWSVLLYKNENIFEDKKQSNGLNFPVYYNELQYPSVGALDLNGKPIDYAKSKDVNLYLELKKNYEDKNYLYALKNVKNLKKNYPNSIFNSDILFYKLKTYDKLLSDEDTKNGLEFDENDLVSEAKAYLRNFAGDKNVPEILYLLVKQYIKLFAKNDANYYLDMLITDYATHVSTQKALLFYADDLYKNKKIREAIKLYEDVLYSSKDLDIASSAALRLVKSNLKDNKIQKAKEYLEKILNANESFLFKDIKDSYKVAKNLVDTQFADVSAKIIEKLLNQTKRVDGNYESMLKDAGIWNEKAHNINNAYMYLKRYQKEFPQGDYKVLVEQSLDRLFFDIQENNTTKLLNYYDILTKKYNNDIAKKAQFAKSKLLFEEKKYNEALKSAKKMDLNNQHAKKLYDEIRIQSIKQALQNDECLKAVNELDLNISLHVNDKEKLYQCLLRTSRYSLAQELAKQEAMNTKSLEWMIKLQHALYKNMQYNDVIKLSLDIQTLGNLQNNQIAYTALYDKFFSHKKLKQYEEALKVAQEIEKNLKDNNKNIKVYEDIIHMYDDNDLVVLSYAQKILQYKDGLSKMSPQSLFKYINSLQNLNRLNKAQEVALLMLDKKMSEKMQVRLYYILAQIYLKQNVQNEAQKYFQKCKQLDENGTWGNICKENLLLIDTNSTK